jgi:hypothetical protein
MRRFAKPLYGLTPVPRVRIPPSPPCSLDCREFPPYFLAQLANFARFLRFLIGKPDYRERATYETRTIYKPFFSEAPMSSPTSSEFHGETQAIKNRAFGECGLDLVS